MEFLIEVLLEICGEAILQIVFEALAEVGIHITRGKWRHTGARSVWRLVVGYLLLGVILGGLSLLVFSQSFAHSHFARVATLLLAPLGAAGATMVLGSLLRRCGQAPVKLDQFLYAYLFAVGFAWVRFIGAT